MFATNYWRYEGVKYLRRDGRTHTGTWNREFRKDLAVTGTWRDGYVELSFTGPGFET